MRKYLICMTFYAGSDEPEDVDRKNYILGTRKKYSQKKMEQAVRKVNRLLDPYEENDFPLSYDEGLNVDTLMEGLRHYLNGKLYSLEKFSGRIAAVYQMEQWF